MTNDANIAVILKRYIESLGHILTDVESKDSGAIHRLFESSRDYRNSFADNSKGSVTPDYSFSVDVVDEPGTISIISAILAGQGINIMNIGINHNREHGEGALRISFYDEASMTTPGYALKLQLYTLSRLMPERRK